VAITAAMPGPTGLLPFQDRFPDRLFDVGIAEQHAVTAAAGMAMGGLRPVVAIYSTFMNRAWDQVVYDVALHRLPVVFCVDRAGITGDDGASHHGLFDMVLFTKVPGMTVFAPSSARELQVMLHDALELCDGPVVIRYPRGASRVVGEHDVGSGLKANKRCSGTDVCILAVGKLVAGAEKAAERLASEGVSVTVWDVRVIRPLDADMLADAATHPIVLTVEDGLRDGGVGEHIADELSERPCRVKVLGIPSKFVPHGKPDRILANLGLDSDGIVASIRDLLG
jgi:1-deoxy-D-xylulose-5-phosphate synthase